MSETRLRILFFAEGATLAHVARPALLTASLDPARFEATLARPASYAWVSDGGNADTRTLACQDSAVFAQRLARGLPLYDTATLERYVVDDLALIDAIEPDVVVGDFRLSLSVSARLRDVPYVTICDAYWSPERPLRAVLPVLPFTRFTPIPLARLLFDALSPLAMRLHTVPLERLRARHGLPTLGHDLRRCYTDADLRLFANFPALFPELVPRDDAAFLGPLAWSPPAPAAFDAAPTGKPLVYVSMGSSGDIGALSTIVAALEACGCDALVSTAGKPVPAALAASSARVFEFLPGDAACAQAQLVICNGGSPTTNQALGHGTPVLGVAVNMDQFLNMQAIEAFGAGLLVRGDRVSPALVARAVTRLLGEDGFARRARLLQTAHHEREGESLLADHLLRLVASRHARGARSQA
ncbi:nucleotide disphospho-sugar-binding domain-containing protein [Thauera sp. SWB20]|uniref:nucleotide disphospho-sugar-binding domain-containing protein n=1 Tax=Thauera sp. SWB20 TaxID=1572758 RepID=UPI0005ADB16C|nr:nucleotide disphospho-sugar-binding domain-containing protein [Thauera sp. SWB20]KIN89260.1 PGL/p-HBAD biosynthesis glycosyltransferasec [Thauera sp. SWB20]